MSHKLKRYDLIQRGDYQPYGTMDECSDGDWVRASDYDSLCTAKDVLVALAKECRDHCFLDHDLARLRAMARAALSGVEE